MPASVREINFIRSDGDDSTGTGAPDAPYKTLDGGITNNQVGTTLRLCDTVNLAATGKTVSLTNRVVDGPGSLNMPNPNYKLTAKDCTIKCAAIWGNGTTDIKVNGSVYFKNCFISARVYIGLDSEYMSCRLSFVNCIQYWNSTGLTINTSATAGEEIFFSAINSSFGSVDVTNLANQRVLWVVKNSSFAGQNILLNYLDSGSFVNSDFSFANSNFNNNNNALFYNCYFSRAVTNPPVNVMNIEQYAKDSTVALAATMKKSFKRMMGPVKLADVGRF